MASRTFLLALMCVFAVLGKTLWPWKFPPSYHTYELTFSELTLVRTLIAMHLAKGMGVHICNFWQLIILFCYGVMIFCHSWSISARGDNIQMGGSVRSGGWIRWGHGPSDGSGVLYLWLRLPWLSKWKGWRILQVIKRHLYITVDDRQILEIIK